MLIRKIFVPLKPPTSILSPTIINCWYSSIFPSEDKIEEDDVKIKNARKLKKWRDEPSAPSTGFLGMLSTDGEVDDSIAAINPTFKPTNFKSWYQAKQREYLKWSQRYIQERHQILGNQLAATHFVLHRGGKVKQKGAADFLCSDDIIKLPTCFSPNWTIEEIDFSNSEICYEGLANFKDIRSLRKISFKGCKHFDDWCLEKFMCICPNVEYLDISDCRNITERGIEGLYRSWHLKNLVVTDFGYGAAFELTCLMLEDSMPGLNMEIIKAPTSNENIK